MKECKKCKVIKPLDNFYKKNKASLDGRQFSCKVCSTVMVKEYRKELTIILKKYK